MLTSLAWLALTTAADITIAVCIITGLLRSKSGWVSLRDISRCSTLTIKMDTHR